jgi:ribosomal-protein-serine acetyltransferase
VASAVAMSPLPVDLGEGVTLRRYEMRDLDALWQAIEEERERIAVWMPFVEGVRTIEDERTWLETVVADEAGIGGGGLWSGSEFLGGVGLSLGPFGIAGEIGYWIRAAYEGRGHITRACRAMIDIGFQELGLHRIEIRAGLENARSRAVPERLGFTYEGIEREGSRGSRGFYDLAVYSSLDREWRHSPISTDR